MHAVQVDRLPGPAHRFPLDALDQHHRPGGRVHPEIRRADVCVGSQCRPHGPLHRPRAHVLPAEGVPADRAVGCDVLIGQLRTEICGAIAAVAAVGRNYLIGQLRMHSRA